MDIRGLQSRLASAGYPCAVDGDMGPRSYAALFRFVGRAGDTALISALGQAADAEFPLIGLTTPLRLAHALARWAVETGGFAKLEENLSYSAERIRAVWPSRFASVAAAAAFARDPLALAEKVYGGRFGNVHPGDGWKYRARGLGQTTFRDNYAAVERVTGRPVVADPDQLADPAKGTRAACIYWSAKGLNAAADRDDAEAVCRGINGGLNGLAEQRGYLARAKLVLR